MALEYIDRPPRIQPELPVDKHTIPAPPTQERDGIEQIIQSVMPLIGMLGFAFASGSGNPLAMAPMFLMMGGTMGFSFWQRGRQNAKLAVKQRLYTQHLLELRQDMTREHNVQRLHYRHVYPDIPTVLEIANRHEASRFGNRLWERRPSDPDFGVIRLGMGTRPSTVNYIFDKQNNPLEDTPLHKDARKLSEDSAIVTDAPVTINLRQWTKAAVTDETQSSDATAVPPRHSVGLFGKNPTATSDFARAILANFCAFHSAQDTRLWVIGHAKQSHGWQWAEWMPHVNIRGIGDDDEDSGKPRAIPQLCFSDELPTVKNFWKLIKKELDTRQVRLRDKKDDDKGGSDVSLPMLLVVVDMVGDLPKDHPLRDVASEAVVAQINNNGPQLGAAIIYLGNDPTRVPSDCQAMVEVSPTGNEVVFRYTEVGLNSPRYMGIADLLNAADARANFAARIRRLELARPFGSDLPRAVDLLQMQSVVEGKRVDTLDKYAINDKWQRSIVPKNSEWLNAPLGMLSMKDVRSLIFSAKEGGDGVHGMIAGTTGSGKSELLMTLIAGLAAKYDPRILNLVLVDYKGGSTIEPFRHLPHTVDLLTNMQANSVERMFVAIQAVMTKRSALLAKVGASDIVKYRSDIAPKLTENDPEPKTFPHLFIIVDEFAEMITANPDYKAKFESIVRLGRAFGVTLILATQRPAGVVTDQMRANMKFRICLRVETPDDSKELLGTADAAFLPNLGGRGYIQSGNELMAGIQVAWAGGPYSEDHKVSLKDVIWLDEESMPADANETSEFTASEVAEALHLKEGELPKTVLEWMVGSMALRAKRDGVPQQRKPWPEPLPEFLALTDPVDASYLNTDRDLLAGKKIVINTLVDSWLNNEEDKNLWPAFSWKDYKPLRVDIGLVDNPYDAENRLLTIDLSTDPLAVFGAAGRGKTTFVKSLLTALAAQRSPDELHMYALDFGRGGLKSITALPHMGASIDASETARVDQLIRMLRNFVNERQERMAKSTANSLSEFNASSTTGIFPEIVCVIDGFIEFKESYEHQMGELMGLIRDGRQFGVYFVITATGLGDLGTKLFGAMTQRVTFAQADAGLYLDLVGRGARPFDNVPGRGLIPVAIKDQPIPLEFQLGVPGTPDLHNDADQIDGFQLIAQRMEKVWLDMGRSRPAAELPRAINMFEMMGLIETGKTDTFKRVGELPFPERWVESMKPGNQEWLKSAVGLISSKDIRVMNFQAQADGVHGMIAGTTGSGKSELLQTLVLSMAMRYDPRIVNFVLVDFKGGATIEPFKKLPHVVDMATDLQGNAVERIFIAIKAEMDRRAALLAKAGVSELIAYRKDIIPKHRSDLEPTFPHLFVVVDEFAEMIAQNPDYRLQFESITRLGRAFGVSLILATQRPAGVVSDQMRANMKFRICLRVETPDDSKELLKRPDAARLPQIAGRGYIQAGTETLTEVQSAYSGINYNDDIPDPRYSTQEILDALELDAEKKPGKLINWLVGAIAVEAKRQAIPKQFKPWPDPLPAPPDPKVPEDVNWKRWPMPLNKHVDASYIKTITETGATSVVLSPHLADWITVIESKAIDTKALKGRRLTQELPLGNAVVWKPWTWKTPLPIWAHVGVVDNPFRSEQRTLSLNVGGDPMVIYGASGKGKTTILKSIVFSLCAQFSPAELNVYALDLGRGGLRSFKNLPHCGAVIDAAAADRVLQLFRMIRSLMAEREERLAKYADMADYNAQMQKTDNPDAMFPGVVVVVDNFAEFKETYENLLPDLMALVRDGRQFGIHYILTANVPNDLGNKLSNLMGQRMTFTMADASQIPEVVGRGALSLANQPGRGLINIEGQPLEFQVAIPVMENAKDPYLVIADAMLSVWTAMGGKQPAAEVPKSVTMLEMWQRIEGRRVDVLSDLDIAARWKRSMEPANSEWLSGPLGLISSKEVRNIWFTAKPGGDGVHGMAAGTTGSGKSELLQTLIASLAIKYDPRIVNFVLIDYKGGPTVEPFRKLPHCVDLATNLDGNAVERIFTAMTAEMNRRSDILAKAGVADLVDYRKKVIPTLKPDSPFPRTFPHLFVIVDEFAEMIVANPDYKQKFESITRLGRSFGVTLLLATQRPSGAVTDQMRANMKFRLCLRVETSDDSKEMIGRNDAQTLPAIPGRGYIQVGGGPVSEIQAAYSGGNYDETRDQVYSGDEILAALDHPLDAPRSLLGWLVGATNAEARRQGIPKQFKPWPDGLPVKMGLNMPFDATYFPPKGVPKPQMILNRGVKAWLEKDLTGLDELLEMRRLPAEVPLVNGVKSLWPAHDFAQGGIPLIASVGLVDNPWYAEQRLMDVDLAGDPMVVLGASGRGKTTFLKSLMLSLAALRSPTELHMYVLDFARGGLKALRTLPHVAGIVDGNEDERVERWFRMLRGIIDDRQTKLQAYDSVADYNAKNPNDIMPGVLGVIDNASEFKEAYEKYQLELISLVRDGRAFGVHFVVSATLANDVPTKLYNILTQHITFTQSDVSNYNDIVGRGWQRFNDTPGRGLCTVDLGGQPVPLEFHTAIPLDANNNDASRDLVKRMADGWALLEKADKTLRLRKPKPIEPLTSMVDEVGMLGELGQGKPGTLQVPLGINDKDREPLIIDLKNKGPHLMIIGPPVTGKTTALRSLVLGLTHAYTPEQLGLVFIDPSDTARRFWNYGAEGDDILLNMPHVLGTITNGKELDTVLLRLRAEFDDTVISKLTGTPGFEAQDNAKRWIVVIADHYDDIEQINKTAPRGVSMATLADIGKGKNMSIIMAGSLGILRMGGDEVRRRVESTRYSVVLQDFETVRSMGVRISGAPTKELPPGRGWIVKAVTGGLMQVSIPVVEGKGGRTSEDQLARVLGDIRLEWSKAKWSYASDDLTNLIKAVKGEETAAAAAEALGAHVQMTGADQAAKMFSDLERLMAEQAAMKPLELPEVTNLISLERDADDPRLIEQAKKDAEAKKKAEAEAKNGTVA